MAIFRFSVFRALCLASFSALILSTQAQTDFQYLAKIPANINSIKDARAEVISFLNKNKSMHFYSDKPFFRVKLLSNKTLINKAVLSDGAIVVTTGLTTFDVDPVKSHNNAFGVWANRIQRESGKHTLVYQMSMSFPGEISTQLYSEDKELMCHLADDFYYIKTQTIADSINKELTRFAEVVAKNKELASKPLPTEEQRKYIVQANAAAQTRQYAQAISYFKQAIQINETGFPDAYFNMSLILAQQNDFKAAIMNMKKYLLLFPNSPDARAGQDKIYEWEAGINK